MPKEIRLFTKKEWKDMFPLSDTPDEISTLFSIDESQEKTWITIKEAIKKGIKEGKRNERSLPISKEDWTSIYGEKEYPKEYLKLEPPKTEQEKKVYKLWIESIIESKGMFENVSEMRVQDAWISKFQRDLEKGDSKERILKKYGKSKSKECLNALKFVFK